MKKILYKLRTFFRFILSPWTFLREDYPDIQETVDLLFSRSESLEAQRVSSRLLDLEQARRSWTVRLNALENKIAAIPVQEMRTALEQLRRHVSVSTDIDAHGNSFCLVVGQYKGRDYVRVFPMPQRDLESLIPMLRSAEKHAHRGRIDVPRGMEVFVERWD